MYDAVDSGDFASPPDGLLSDLKEYILANDGDEMNERLRAEAVVGAVHEILAEATDGHEQIDTRSGEVMTPLDPDPKKIDIKDIAHGLSNVGRFAGQGREFYSVARHSVHVSLEVEARGGSTTAQQWGLLHDGAEAYLSDVPGPVKQSLPGYKHAERRLDRAIMGALGLAPTEEDWETVEAADKDVGRHELTKQFPEGDHRPPGLMHDWREVGKTEDPKRLFHERAQTLGLGPG